MAQSDPERWADRVRPYLQQIEAYEWESLQTPPRRRNKRSAAQSEPERWLTRIRTDWEQGDFPAAEAKLTALSEILPDDPASEPIRGVINAWQKGLSEQQRESPDRRAFVESALSRAESLRPEAPDRCRSIARGVLFLYRDDPALQDLLDKARLLAIEVPRESGT
ncbi:MAG: hypothetical protein U0872_16050 [Planctomycetaceae bacterium]